MKREINKEIYTHTQGKRYPLGASVQNNGVNFSVFSSTALKMELLLFYTNKDTEPFQIIELHKKDNCEFGFWSVFVENLKPGTYYAYKVHRTSGNFSKKVLIDPYTKGIDTSLWVVENARIENNEDNTATSMRGCVVDMSNYDWEGVEKPHIMLQETIIYELHVKGFTYSHSSNVKNRGTYSGLAEKIPYLKELGVTAVELLPVMQFDETENNYWGYNTVGFFAPHSAYCLSEEEHNQVNEFRDMVKEFHRNGIEVILDVVYNHTREGNEEGPIISFKGFDNKLYYSINHKGKYNNFSACGNSLNCNHPIVQKLILESLEFWAKEMKVDGFRFDLSTVLTLDTHGKVMEFPPVLWGIELRETLSDCKLIAEPWSGDGSKKLYQLGDIHGFRWSQWNGRFRDCIRNFVRGIPGIIDEVATRIAGSADLYEKSGHLPINSINFITCHDGFTMNDLVSYEEKHNWENGEDNIDGTDDNLSCNWGIEGDSDNPETEKIRRRQIKNFITILMLSKGVPMILAGDEMRRTQNGNNNGYRLDNEQGWLNWDLLEKNMEILNFFKKMISLRKETYFLQTKHFYTGTIYEKHSRGLKDITWHGIKLNKPAWEDKTSQVLAFTISGVAPEHIKYLSNHIHKEHFKDQDLHVMMNMSAKPLNFEIPQVKDRQWFKYVDTFERENREDILHTENTYLVMGKSIVVLISK